MIAIDHSVATASCSSNTIEILLETIEPFSSIATLMSVVRLPKSCVASEVNVSDGGSKGVLVSTVTPPWQLSTVWLRGTPKCVG